MYRYPAYLQLLSKEAFYEYSFNERKKHKHKSLLRHSDRLQNPVECITQKHMIRIVHSFGGIKTMIKEIGAFFSVRKQDGKFHNCQRKLIKIVKQEAHATR